MAGRADYSVGEVAKWFAYHVGELSLALGVIPFAALILLALMPRQLTERDRIFVAAALSLSFWLVLMVAVFASEQTFRISERNTFYVGSLFLIALLVWIERGLPRPQPATAIAALLAVGLPLAIPYDDFIGLNAVSDTAALLPLGWLVEQGLALSDASLVVLAGAVVTGLAFLFVPRRYALALPALVLVYFAVSQYPIVDQHRFRSAQHLFGGIAMEDRDWIDRSVGRDEDVAFLWTGTSNEFTIWENEIFSRTIGDIYTTGPAVAGGLAQTPVSIDRSTGYVRGPDGSRVPCRTCSPTQPGSSEAPWSARTASSAWFSIASTARCGRWHSSTGSIRRTRGRGSTSRTRATSAPGASWKSRCRATRRCSTSRTSWSLESAGRSSAACSSTHVLTKQVLRVPLESKDGKCVVRVRGRPHGDTEAW